MFQISFVQAAGTSRRGAWRMYSIDCCCSLRTTRLRSPVLLSASRALLAIRASVSIHFRNIPPGCGRLCSVSIQRSTCQQLSASTWSQLKSWIPDNWLPLEQEAIEQGTFLEVMAFMIFDAVQSELYQIVAASRPTSLDSERRIRHDNRAETNRMTTVGLGSRSSVLQRSRP